MNLHDSYSKLAEPDDIPIIQDAVLDQAKFNMISYYLKQYYYRGAFDALHQLCQQHDFFPVIDGMEELLDQICEEIMPDIPGKWQKK